VALSLAVALGSCGGDDDTEPSARSQWSVFEDHDALVREGEAQRERTLEELRALGVDTLRIGIKWNEAAPRPLARRRPSFDATEPNAYPGFGNYDDLLRRAVIQSSSSSTRPSSANALSWSSSAAK